MSINNVSAQRTPSQRSAIDDAPSTARGSPAPSQRMEHTEGLPSRTPSSRSLVDDSAHLRGRALLPSTHANLREDDRASMLSGNRSSRSDSAHFSESSIAMGRTESIIASLSRTVPQGAMPHLSRELTMTDLAAQVPPPPTSGTVLTPLSEAATAQRSWRSVASAIAQSARNLPWASVANEAALTLRSVIPHVDLPSAKRTLGAIAGHTLHQAVAVGLPTFAREMLAAGVTQALHAAPPGVAMGLQASVGVANLALQVIREGRERRNPDEAARAYHSLSPREWAAKSPDEQASMRAHTAKVSRAITVSQVASSITNFALMASAFQQEGHRPDARADALKPLATEIKTGVYTAMRDAIQASFNLVGLDKTVNTHGLKGAPFAAAVATYAGVNAGTSLMGEAMMASLVPNRSQATNTLLGMPAQAGAAPMSTAQAWSAVAQGAGVSAFANVVAEATDWYQRAHQELSQVPVAVNQVWQPNITGDDRSRVADQTAARTALVNGLNSVGMVLGRVMAPRKLPPAVQTFVGTGASVALAAVVDSPISGIWQAQAAVRDSVRPNRTPQPDLESGTPFPPNTFQAVEFPSRGPSQRFTTS
jgi:hypothetical protein